MKRNAASKRKAACQTTNATKVPHDDNINPNDMLRATLVTMGYQIEEINVALDEMWNLLLKYDEVDAVLNYLQERKPTVAPVLAAPPTVMSSRGSNDSEVPAALSSENGKEEEAETVSTVDSSTPAKRKLEPPRSQRQQPPNTIPQTVPPVPAPVVAAKNPRNGGTTSSASADSTEQQRAAPPAASAQNDQRESKRKGRRAVVEGSSSDVVPQPPQNDLGSKLDTVANADNLMDAISALTQWVTEAASVSELRQFCSGTITRALFIVV